MSLVVRDLDWAGAGLLESLAPGNPGSVAGDGDHNAPTLSRSP